MKLPFLPCPSCAKSHFPYQLALATGLLLGFLPLATHAQSVTFGGALTTLPASGLELTIGITRDLAGSVYISDAAHHRIVQLPWTGTGFGPQTALPAGLNGPYSVVADSAGDVFALDTAIDPYLRVVEIPKTASGYGPLKVLYSPGEEPSLNFNLAIDNAGNLFTDQVAATDGGGYELQVVELPVTEMGYGAPIVLPTDGLGTGSITTDSSGNLIFSDYDDKTVVELPKTASGFGPLTTLYSVPKGSLDFAAVDNNQNLIIEETGAGEFGEDVLVRVPHTATGYGPALLLPFFSDDSAARFSLDSTGNIFALTNADVPQELQLNSVNFNSANVCAHGATHPEPCSQTLSFSFNINTDVTLGTPKLLTSGAPSLDFTLARLGCDGARSAGEYCTLDVAFTPLAPGTRSGELQIVDNGGSVLATVSISGVGTAIGDAAQTVSFDRISAQTAASSIPLTASATSGLPVTFISNTQKICTAIGDTAYLLASGECLLEARQDGNAVYYPATKHQGFFVHHADQTIDFDGISSQVVGNQLILTGTSSSGLPLDFHSRTTDVCTVSSRSIESKTYTAIMVAAGTCTLRAEQAGNNEYYPAPPVDRSFQVTSAP